MKMTRWSPDERLRTVADCLSRLRDLGPDPMTRLNGRHTRRDLFVHFFIGPGPVLGPSGGEFQPSFAAAHAGGGAHLITLLQSILALKTVF